MCILKCVEVQLSIIIWIRLFCSLNTSSLYSAAPPSFMNILISISLRSYCKILVTTMCGSNAARSWVQIPPGPFLTASELRYIIEFNFGYCRTKSLVMPYPTFVRQKLKFLSFVSGQLSRYRFPLHRLLVRLMSSSS